MSFTLSSHGVGSCPAKGRGIHLSTLISTAGMCASKHSVCKSCMREPHIAKHPVIGRKLSCKRGVKQVRTPHCVVLCTVSLAWSGVIIHRPARVMKSIGATLRDRTCPLRLELMLDTTMCAAKTWWKLQSCVRSAKSVVRECSSLRIKFGPLTAASQTMLSK
jgi:hypothetical protein